MRILPIADQPSNHVSRLPKIPFPAKLLMTPNVTVSGVGTNGLGDQCKTANAARVECAFSEWVQYKKSLPTPPRPLTHSPRDRYSLQRQAHEEAIEKFLASQQENFKRLHDEKKRLTALLNLSKSQTLESQFEQIKQEREDRRIRLEQYAWQKIEMARMEKELADQLAAIWRQAGVEEEQQWKQWIADRKKQQEQERTEFEEAQRARAEKLQELAEQMRRHKKESFDKIQQARQEEVQTRQKAAAELRKRDTEMAQAAKDAHEANVLRQAESRRQELRQWAAHRKSLEAATRSYVKSRHEAVLGSLKTNSTNAWEESVLRNQLVADSVRAWKQEYKSRACSSLN